MKLYMLRIYQSSLAAAVILILVVLSIYGISLADGATEKATHKTGVSHSAVKARAKSSAHAVRTDRFAEAYGLLPLSFEANRGQTDPSVQFISHGAGYTLFLAREEAVLELQKPDETDALLRKMAPKVRKRFEARKFYHASPRFRSQRKAEIVRVGIAGANPDPTIRPQDQLPGKSNYFVGNDPKKWRTGIPSYRRVEYEGIYPGVDLIYYGNQSHIEFDFVVAPRVDPSLISLHVQTDGHLQLEENGSLRVNTSAGSVVLQRPNIYQVEGDKRRLVHGGFVLKGDHEIGFQVAKYDRRKPLIVDPVLSYSTFLGGGGSDFAGGIAVDSLGDAYIVGQATSTNFPIENSYPASANANGIAFISKLDPTGTTLLYSTYLGGTGGEYGAEIALDPSANVYVTGYTTSSDFPVVDGCQTALGTPNGNAFVARIDTTQSGVASLVYSTYLGGGGNSTNSLGDTGLGIAADASGFAYVTGQTASDASMTPFPTTSSAYQSSLANPNGNAFLSVLDTNQTGSASLVYSTYLGGDSTGFGDYGMGVAVDSSGDAFITGETTSGGSTPFPTTSNAYQTTLNSVYGNVFITEIATEQSGSQSLVYSTYLGGSSTVIIGDSGSAIALDSSGKVYVDGDTTSSDFPVTLGAFQTTNSAGGKAFVAKFDLTQSGTQSLVYSTYLGGTNGSEGEVANDIAVDANGDAFASGSTSSSDFPTTSDAYQTAVKNNLWNVYLTQMNPTGTGLLYSTYLGGSCSTGYGDLGFGVAVDVLGNAYIDGSTCSSDFPIDPSNAYQTSLAGPYNAFIAKFALNPNPGITAIASPVANASGWDSVPVTVSFTCIPGGAPIQTCPSPTTVSTEGANQVVSGTAVDTGNNTATASATVNLDFTPPVVNITSPSNGAIVGTSYVVVSGTATDALSGVANVTCNNVPASLSGSNFSCTVPLASVSNSITVTGIDLAGNSASANINVSVSMAAPTSLQVTPTNPNLLVGGTQSFTAVDQTGTARPDATWSVSDTTIANFVSGQPNTLIGVAAGQATLTATIGTVSAQTTVTVLAGSSLAPGTVLWSATPVSGFTTQQIVQAVPTASGPDLYSVETDSNGNYLVRALHSDGEHAWQNAVTQTVGNGFLVTNAFGDNAGGLLLGGYQNNGGANSLVDLNGQTGNEEWQHAVTQTNGGLDTSSLAVGSDGTIYIVETGCSQGSNSQGGYYIDCLDSINGSTGALVNQIQLPEDYYTLVNPDCIQGNQYSNGAGAYGAPMVAPDGSVYLEVENYNYSDTYTCSGQNESVTYAGGEQLTLLHVLVNGTTTSQILESNNVSNSNNPPNTALTGDVIPDGSGGVLASLAIPNGGSWPYPLTVADVTSQGTTATIFAAVSDGYGYNAPQSMVLGNDGTAFVTDGLSVVNFNATTLQQNWTYASTGGALSFVAATSDGGVAVSDSQLGTIQLDANGNASQPVAMNSPTNSWSGQWFNVPASGSGVEQIAMPMVVDPDSVWAVPNGNPSASGAAGALCACDIQADPPPPPPPPPVTCQMCRLRSPDCTPVSAGSASAYLILIGDPGINTTTGHHNVGPDFALSAQTQANSLQSQGHKVIACRVSSVQDVESALTTHGMIDGGIFYFGHAGATSYIGDPNVYSALFVGQASGFYTNITAKNINQLTNPELKPNIVMTLNACNAGAAMADGNPPIAQLLAQQLKITVEAYAGYMHFSKSDAEDDKTVNGGGIKPSGLPMYMNADGAPPRPQPIYFFPPQ